MRVYEWHEAGNTLYKTGLVFCESTPVGWWLLDKWLHWFGDEVAHFIDNRLGNPLDKLSPSWGNPICAAYLLKWSPFFHKRQRQEVWLNVRFDQLSERTQKALLRENEELHVEEN